MPIGRSLLLIDDLGIPTKSMFRFVYNEKIAEDGYGDYSIY